MSVSPLHLNYPVVISGATIHPQFLRWLQSVTFTTNEATAAAGTAVGVASYPGEADVICFALYEVADKGVGFADYPQATDLPIVEVGY